MSNINKDLFSYICPSCSGQLLVNDANKTYVCESCGNSYDYNYFLSNDTYSKAEKSLLRGEYKSASNMYDFILAKVPNSFIAKVGKVFADNSISGISDYTTNKIGKVPLKRNCSKYKVYCIYEDAGDFSDGIAYVKLNGKYGFIDKNGNVILK